MPSRSIVSDRVRVDGRGRGRGRGHGNEYGQKHGHCIQHTEMAPRHAIARFHSSRSGGVGGPALWRAMRRSQCCSSKARVQVYIATVSVHGCTCSTWARLATHT